MSPLSLSLTHTHTHTQTQTHTHSLTPSLFVHVYSLICTICGKFHVFIIQNGHCLQAIGKLECKKVPNK
jgi:hypothetical protein